MHSSIKSGRSSAMKPLVFFIFLSMYRDNNLLIQEYHYCLISSYSPSLLSPLYIPAKMSVSKATPPQPLFSQGFHPLISILSSLYYVIKFFPKTSIFVLFFYVLDCTEYPDNEICSRNGEKNQEIRWKTEPFWNGYPVRKHIE